ncbi:MAG: phenylacetate--CoA ligase family protein [Gemmatimonadales bacterium]
MNPEILAIYHCLPAPARSAAASLRGWYLNRWRSGRDTARLIDEALDRDRWSAQQWQTWREERMAFILHRAATRIPYYREYWAARRRHGDSASWELLENWPLLEKEAVRSAPRAFVADDRDLRKMFPERTSGTTGTPLEIWRSRDTVTQLYAIATARTRAWDDISPGARWARLGGQLVTPVQQRRPPFWVWNMAMRQLYMSSYHLAPDLIPHYLDALIKYRIIYMAGYPSAIYALARQALRAGRKDLRMAAIYTNAEPLYDEQRRTIAEAFQCPVRQTYGMAETVAAASECSEAHLHQWPEAGHIEVQPDGELVCTSLLNPDMILVRYRVGDRGQLCVGTQTCGCGRGLPVLASIEGRMDDLLITRDGRTAAALDIVFDGITAIREAQIVQERLDLVRVRVAVAPGFSMAHEQTITTGVRDRLGEVQVVVDRVDVVPRTANGKLRAVVCNLSAEERIAATSGRPKLTVTT